MFRYNVIDGFLKTTRVITTTGKIGLNIKKLTKDNKHKKIIYHKKYFEERYLCKIDSWSSKKIYVYYDNSRAAIYGINPLHLEFVTENK